MSYSAARIDDDPAERAAHLDRANTVRRVFRLWLMGTIAARIYHCTAPTHPASDWALHASCALENEAEQLQKECAA